MASPVDNALMPGPSGTSKVAAVIVTHNSSSTIAATLQSAARLNLAQVIVVDNASTDATLDVIESAKPAGAQLVQQDNLGFGAGNNRGAREVRADVAYVLFLNPDASIDQESLDPMVDYLDRHAEVAMVGPRVHRGSDELHSVGSAATLWTEMRTLFPPPISRAFPDRRRRPGSERTGPAGYVLGACMLIRRKALDAIGGFDEGFFLFFEELDVANRLRAAGWQVHHVAESSAAHEVSTSRKAVTGGAQEHYWASTWRYLRLYRGPRAAAAWAAVARLTWWVRLRTGRIDRTTYQRWRSALDAVRSRTP